ncbi:hypothetical protein Tco_0080452, partial [Tanacetum coccineum]
PTIQKPKNLPLRGVGMKGQALSQTGTSNPMVDQDSKKRAFGTELTNICFKRSKLVTENDRAANQHVKPLLASSR